MKGIFIAYNQAYNEEVADLLEGLGQRGYTVWTEVGGRGSVEGEPHLGNHAWPTQNHAIFTAVDDRLADDIMKALRKTDENNPKLGLRAYLWNIEQAF
jgi:nitrogen regulatory protein PII